MIGKTYQKSIFDKNLEKWLKLDSLRGSNLNEKKKGIAEHA